MAEYIREHHKGSKGKNIISDTHRKMVVKKGDELPGFDYGLGALNKMSSDTGLAKRPGHRPKPTHDATVRLESKSKLKVTKPRKSR